MRRSTSPSGMWIRPVTVRMLSSSRVSFPCGSTVHSRKALVMLISPEPTVASSGPGLGANLPKFYGSFRAPAESARPQARSKPQPRRGRRAAVPGAPDSAIELADIEAWAEHYIVSADLRVKLAPPPVPSRFREGAVPVRLAEPGRPPELRLARRGERTPKLEALKEPHYRARMLHTFWHHE